MNTKGINIPKLNIKKHSLYSIRSFVVRNSRITNCQKNAINKYWQIMGIPFQTEFLDIENYFGRIAPLILEIGFGMGDSLVKMAKNHPENNFIGIEVYLPGIGKCLKLAQDFELNNLYIIYHDAIEVLEYMIKDNSLNKLQLFCPDTWHKKRHHKRRIVQISFLKLVMSKLNLNGILHISTDNENYAYYMIQTINEIKNFYNLSKNHSFVVRTEQIPITKFEQRGCMLGNKIFDLMFKKINNF